jgi:Flp pilus assembly protein CpaB
VTTDTNSRAASDQQPRPAPQRSTSLGHDLPRVQRRYGQWVGAVLFVVMAAVLAGWFWQQKSDRQEVLVVAHPVPAGAVLTSHDLKVVEVAGVDAAISSSDSESVIGSTAAVGLVESQILTPDMITSDPVPGPGQRVIGLQLDATRAPAGLRPGDAVFVLAVPPAGDPSAPDELDDPTVLAPRATVASNTVIEGAGARITLLLPEAVAERVTAYVAAGRVALVQAPIGGDG